MEWGGRGFIGKRRYGMGGFIWHLLLTCRLHIDLKHKWDKLLKDYVQGHVKAIFVYVIFDMELLKFEYQICVTSSLTCIMSGVVYSAPQQMCQNVSVFNNITHHTAVYSVPFLHTDMLHRIHWPPACLPSTHSNTYSHA